MNKWFADTFLQSLHDRNGTRATWLTRAQTRICTENMEKHTIRIAQFQGDPMRHDNYTCTWNGREVWLSYSKLNGCGVLTIGNNSKEQEQNRLEEQKRLEQVKADRIVNIRNNPERCAKHIKRAEQAIENAQKEIDELISYNDPEDDSEIAYHRSIIEKANKTLEELQ